MKITASVIACFLFIAISSLTVKAQITTKNPASFNRQDPWTNSQLMQPAELVALLNNKQAKQPLIYNIGVVQDIKGAKNMGAASEEENLVRFKKTLETLPKNASVVVYCGCCPFVKCPNIRPAFQALKDKGFANARLLNLPTNLKTNWIDLGYPLAAK